MLSSAEYEVMGNDLLTITIACETMTVEIVCTPHEFAELRDNVEVAMRHPYVGGARTSELKR